MWTCIASITTYNNPYIYYMKILARRLLLRFNNYYIPIRFIPSNARPNHKPVQT